MTNTDPTVSDLAGHILVVHEKIETMEADLADLKRRVADLERSADGDGADTDDLADRVFRVETLERAHRASIERLLGGHERMRAQLDGLASIVRNLSGGEQKQGSLQSGIRPARFDPAAATTEKEEAELALLKAVMLALGVKEIMITEAVWEKSEGYTVEGKPGFNDDSVIRLVPKRVGA